MSHPERYEHHIGGRRVAPCGGDYFPSINPTTGQVLYSVKAKTARHEPSSGETATKGGSPCSFSD